MSSIAKDSFVNAKNYGRKIRLCVTGKWKFKLYAYKDDQYQNLVFYGENETVTLSKGSSNKVSITAYRNTVGTGKLIIDFNNISLIPKDDQAQVNTQAFSKVATVTKLNTNQVVTNLNELAHGTYKVQIDFVSDGFTYASGYTVASIYANLDTTVSGTLNEVITKTEFDAAITDDFITQSLLSNSFDASTQNDLTIGTAEDKVKVTVKKEVYNDLITAVPDPTTSGTVERLVNVNVDTASVTANSTELEINFNQIIKVNEGGNVTQTNHPFTGTLSEKVTVNVQLRPGLESVTVKHKNEAMSTDDYSYNAETGVLTIQTNSFSPFKVEYEDSILNKEVIMKGVKYGTLQDAFSAIQNSDEVTIKLLHDVYGASGAALAQDKNVVFDLAGYEYVVNQNPVDTDKALTIPDCSSLTIKNGKVSVSSENRGANNGTFKYLIQNNGTLKLEDVTIDANGIATDGYGISNNKGTLLVTKNTNINALSDVVALSLSSTQDEVTVTFDNEYTGKVVGRIEYIAKEGAIHKIYEKLKLYIHRGDFTEASIYANVNNPTIEVYTDNYSTSVGAYKFIYVSTKDELKAAFENGNNIKLNNDIDLSSDTGSFLSPVIIKDMVIDFNGYGLNHTIVVGSYAVAENQSFHNVVFRNTGSSEKTSIVSTFREVNNVVYQESSIHANYGTITVDGGKYTGTNAVLKSRLQTNNTDAIGFIINGGEFKNTNGEIVFSCVVGKNIINGGKFETMDSIFSVRNENSTVDTELIINGGQFKGRVLFDLYKESASDTHTEKIVVNGGTFELVGFDYNGRSYVPRILWANFVEDGTKKPSWADIEIKGGTFIGLDPSTVGGVIAEGYKSQSSGANTWTVVPNSL